MWNITYVVCRNLQEWEVQQVSQSFWLIADSQLMIWGLNGTRIYMPIHFNVCCLRYCHVICSGSTERKHEKQHAWIRQIRQQFLYLRHWKLFPGSKSLYILLTTWWCVPDISICLHKNTQTRLKDREAKHFGIARWAAIKSLAVTDFILALYSVMYVKLQYCIFFFSCVHVMKTHNQQSLFIVHKIETSSSSWRRWN